MENMETSSQGTSREKSIFDELAVGCLTYSNLLSLNVHNFLDLVSFCMLIRLIPEENIRRLVDKSRITLHFWKLLKSKYFEHMSISIRSLDENRLLKTYKYIYYFKSFQTYDCLMVTKAFFIIKENGYFSNFSKMADIDKHLTKYMKNIVTKKKLANDLLDLNKCSLDQLIISQVTMCSFLRSNEDKSIEDKQLKSINFSSSDIGSNMKEE